MRRILAVLTMAVALAAGSKLMASPTNGYDYDVTTINANATNSYDVVLQGGQLSEVDLHSYGSTFLTVGVYDNAGNLIAVDSDQIGDAVLTFFVPFSGTYHVVVLNNAPISNSFVITVT